MAGEIYIKKYGMYVSGFSSSPFGIEWMRFDKNSPISDLVKTVPHIAFEVDDLQEAIKGLELIDEISSPAEGIKVAMFQHNGAPVELIEFS
ncbi:MAG: VOC family protein [Bacteroidetes bacterium]|nr:VOC family protein [Bacteroidota bacterium]